MQDYSLPSSKVGTAVTEAMADLKMASIEPGRDGAVYKIQAKTEDNRTVMVTLRPHQTQTRVSCRVGLFGDELALKGTPGADGRPARNTSPRRYSRSCPELARLQPILLAQRRVRRRNAQGRRGSTLSRSRRPLT